MPKTLYLFTKKLPFWVDPAHVFTELFAKQDYSFWLDSAMPAKDLARFSFMGAIGTDTSSKIALSGKLSRLIDYSVHNQQVRCQYPHQPTKHPPRCHNTKQQNLFDFLQHRLAETTHQLLGDPVPFAFDCGFVGYLGYELKGDLTGNSAHQSQMPDACFIQTDRAIAFDHLERQVYLLCLLAEPEQTTATSWFKQMRDRLYLLTKTPQPKRQLGIDKSASGQNKSIAEDLTQTKANYLQDIHTCQQKIRAGESYEICLTNRLRLETHTEPLDYYLRLRQEHPAPYAAFFRFADTAIACFSPERFLQISQQKNGKHRAESKPIKGTIKRGTHPDEDEHLRNQLKHSTKDRAENLMIVDLVRNDLGMVCTPGSIHVDKLMAIETYTKVHHMVSTISGVLKPEQDSIDCIKALFPAGSMTGAPKIRTMEIIDQLEPDARGIYAGALGYIGFNGLVDLNVVIRTAVFQKYNQQPHQQPHKPYQVSINSGGAITVLSDAKQEFDELILKISALWKELYT